MRLFGVLLVIAACGGSAEPTQRSGPAASPIATPSGGDDVVVAQVNGRPVYGSCVAAQATAHGASKQAALDDCIAFELMALEAEARGLASDPEVVEATRTALVSRVVEVGFEQRYQSPADLADVMAMHIERNKARLSRPELRASAYARIDIPENAPPDLDAKARAEIEKLAAQLADERGLTAQHLDDIVKRFDSELKITVAVVERYPRRGLVGSYADALWSIDEVGRVLPQAVRTMWGWDVILLTEIMPAVEYTREQAAIEAFPEVRRGYFTIWVDQIAKSLGVRVTIDPKQVAKLDEVGP